jgi:hypothetical protein
MLHPYASGIVIIITTNINSDIVDEYYNDDEKVKLSHYRPAQALRTVGV